MTIFHNVTEVTFALIGLALGVLYGLDGWRGASQYEFNVCRQPRVLNLTWVLGTAFAGFLGSLVFEPVSRARLALLLFFAIHHRRDRDSCRLGNSHFYFFHVHKTLSPRRISLRPLFRQ